MEQRRAKLAHFDNEQRRAAREAFGIFLQYGKRGLTAEQRSQSTTTSGGGYTIQVAYGNQFIESLSCRLLAE